MTNRQNLTKDAEIYLDCIDNPVDYDWLKDSSKEYRVMISLYESGMMTYHGILTEKGENSLQELRKKGLVGGSRLKRTGEL